MSLKRAASLGDGIAVTVPDENSLTLGYWLTQPNLPGKTLNTISIEKQDAELHIRLPFPLRDAFRTIFKTAAWDSGKRSYVVRDTSANRNKFERFREAASEAAYALDLADDVSATELQLKQMRQAMEVAKHSAECIAAKAMAAREELARLRSVLANAVADAQAAEAELCAVSAAIENELSPVKSLCERLGVRDAFVTLKRLSSRRFLLAEQKKDFDAACRTLREANDQVRVTLHVSLPALVELADASYNRLDKVRDSLVRHENVYRGLVPCEMG